MGIIHWSLGQFWFLLRRPAFCGLLSSFVCYFFWCGGFAKIGHSLAWYLGGASPGFGSVDDHQRRGCLITLGPWRPSIHRAGVRPGSRFVTRVTEGLRGRDPVAVCHTPSCVVPLSLLGESTPGEHTKHRRLESGWSNSRNSLERADSEETRAGTTAQNLA